MLSKMHFASEMAKQGNRVFFVNPPRPSKENSYATVLEQRGNITIIQLKQIKGRLTLRYKAYWLYKILTNRYVKGIQKITGAIDEVWCFDPNSYCDLRKFKAHFALLLLYDFYKGDNVIQLANTADGIVSVSQVILDHYDKLNVPRLLVQHGLGSHFSDKSKKILTLENYVLPAKIKVGYVGNLFREGVRTDLAHQIIMSHPNIEFHFWGPSSLQNSNLSTVYNNKFEEAEQLLNILKTAPNVFFHGVKNQQELSEDLFEMDAFLFLYSYEKDVNHASNAHKILEYLSTGKVVISTFVSNYENSDLLTMAQKKQEDTLPELFKEVVLNLDEYNSIKRQNSRINFALDNTYAKQIERIRSFVTTTD